jgi:hypothetical protein
MSLVSPIPVRSISETDQWVFFTEPNHDRGVVDVEACFFIDGAGRGATPRGSVAPYAAMRPEAAGLTAAEEVPVTLAVHQQVRESVLAGLEAACEVVDRVEALPPRPSCNPMPPQVIRIRLGATT